MSTIRYDCIYNTVAGDTLSAVALNYGVEAFDLLTANSELATEYSLSSQLPQGTRLMVPCQPVTNAQIAFTPCTYIANNNTNLEDVARALDTTTSHLLYYSNGNNQPIANTVVSVAGCYNAVNNLYITKRGDTLSSISARFQIPVATLATYNTITGNIDTPLPPGQTLIIPAASTVSRSEASGNTPRTSNGNNGLYQTQQMNGQYDSTGFNRQNGLMNGSMNGSMNGMMQTNRQVNGQSNGLMNRMVQQ